MDPAPDAVRLTEGFFEHLLRLLQSGQKVLPPPPPYIDRPLLERMMKDYDARILRGRDNFTDGNSSIRSPAQSSPSITSLSVSSAPMLSQPATPNFATIPPPIASSLHQRQTQPSMNGPGQAHLNVQTAPNHTPVRRNIPSPSLAYPPPHQPPAGPTVPHMNVNEASMLKPPMNGPNQIGLYANSQTRSATGPSFSLPAREPQPQPQTQPQPRPQPPNFHPSSQFQPFNEGFSVSDSRSVSSSSISFPYDHHQPPRQAQVPMANSTAFHRPADGYSNPSQTVGANVHLGPFFHAAVPNPPLAGPSRQKPNNLHHTNMSAQFHGTNHGRGVPFAPPLSSPDLSQPPSGGHRQVHQIPKPSTPMPSTTPYAHIAPLTKVSARPPPPPRRVVLSQTPSRDILRALGRFDLLRGFLDESPDENQAPSASRRPSNPSTEPTTTIPKSPPSNILVQVPDAVPGLPPANLVVVGDSLDPELHSSQSTTPSTDLAAPPPIPPTVDPKTTHPALDQSNPPLSSDSARSLKRKRIDNLPGATHEMDVVTPSKSPRPGFPRLRERSKTSSPAPHGSPSTLVTDHTVPTSPLSDVHVNLPDLPQVVDVPDDTPLRHSVPRGLLPASNRSELRKVSPSTTASPRQPLVPTRSLDVPDSDIKQSPLTPGTRPLFIPSDDEASAFGGSPINNHSGASSTTMVTTFKPLNLQPFTRAGSIGQKDAEIGSAQPPSDHLAKPGAPEAPQRRLPQVYVEVPLLTLQQKIAIHVHASREDARLPLHPSSSAIPCYWRDCTATLSNEARFQKHFHLAHPPESTHRCRWRGCNQKLSEGDSVFKHVLVDHTKSYGRQIQSSQPSTSLVETRTTLHPLPDSLPMYASASSLVKCAYISPQELEELREQAADDRIREQRMRRTSESLSSDLLPVSSSRASSSSVSSESNILVLDSEEEPLPVPTPIFEYALATSLET